MEDQQGVQKNGTGSSSKETRQAAHRIGTTAFNKRRASDERVGIEPLQRAGRFSIPRLYVENPAGHVKCAAGLRTGSYESRQHRVYCSSL
jgi:hypothetical protein